MYIDIERLHFYGGGDNISRCEIISWQNYWEKCLQGEKLYCTMGRKLSSTINKKKMHLSFNISQDCNFLPLDAAKSNTLGL